MNSAQYGSLRSAAATPNDSPNKNTTSGGTLHPQRRATKNRGRVASAISKASHWDRHPAHTQLAIQAQPHRHRSGGGFRMEHVRENPSARPANKERRSQSSSTLNPPEQRRVTLAGQTSVTRARIQQRQFRTGQTRSRRFAQLFRCPPRFVRRRYSATNFLPHPFKTASAERTVVRRYESNDARKAAGDLGKPSRVHVTPIVRQQRETRDRER